MSIAAIYRILRIRTYQSESRVVSVVKINEPIKFVFLNKLKFELILFLLPLILDGLVYLCLQLVEL